jgi:DNA adenine methylase
MSKTKPKRPVLRWHGGKWVLAPWIIDHFPKHRVYVEPFGGAASVLLRKERTYSEVYNDLDQGVVSLFRVLRSDRANELISALELTPFSREEMRAAWEACSDEVEQARRLIVRSFQGFGSNACSSSASATGFRANSNRSGTTPAHDWMNYPKSLPAIVERLRGVVIENSDAIDVMQPHDGPNTLHFVDPPYLPETRKTPNRGYNHEMTYQDHERLLQAVRELRGNVVLCGYPSELYETLLTDWRRVTRSAYADGARPRTEVLWMNFEDTRDLFSGKSEAA